MIEKMLWKKTDSRVRVVVRLSSKHTRIQFIHNGRTIGEVTTATKGILPPGINSGSIEAAVIVAQKAAEFLLEKGITKAVLDRGHHPYKGRMKAVAEKMRECGIEM